MQHQSSVRSALSRLHGTGCVPLLRCYLRCASLVALLRLWRLALSISLRSCDDETIIQHSHDIGGVQSWCDSFHSVRYRIAIIGEP